MRYMLLAVLLIVTISHCHCGIILSSIRDVVVNKISQKVGIVTNKINQPIIAQLITAVNPKLSALFNAKVNLLALVKPSTTTTQNEGDSSIIFTPGNDQITSGNYRPPPPPPVTEYGPPPPPPITEYGPPPPSPISNEYGLPPP